MALDYLSMTALPWTAMAQTSFSLAHTTATCPLRCLHSAFQDGQLLVGVTTAKRNLIFTVRYGGYYAELLKKEEKNNLHIHEKKSNKPLSDSTEVPLISTPVPPMLFYPD